MAQRVMGDIVRDQKPLVFRPETPVKEAARQMCARRVGAALVADGEGRLAGIFTGRDGLCRMLAKGLDPATTTLAEVMTRNPATMSPGAPSIEALLLMQDGGFRHVPIVENGRIVGIVSRYDFRGVEEARLDEETGYAERLW